jgi:putative sigma-54 modulation protein
VSVEVVVRSKDCAVPTRLKEEAVERITHATRFFDRLVDIELVFSAQAARRARGQAVVELTGHTKRHHIRAEGAGEDHRAAFDVAIGRFERQLARYKSRLLDKTRGRAAHRTPVPTGDGQLVGAVRGDGRRPDDDAEPLPRIVRLKRFALRPMLPEEAGLQLELLGHDFYLFTNAGTGEANVVYRRRDGDLGLIEPTVD